MLRKTICCLVLLLFTVVGFCQVTAGGKTNSGLPRVVGSIRLWNKTGDIEPITLFTPKHFGVYRVSGVAVVTKQLDNSLDVDITFRDGGRAQQFSFSALGDVGDYPMGPSVFRDFSGVPIQLSVTSGGTQAGKYNLFVVIEQIM